MHQFDLKNKTAIITGGAQGFGLEIAKKFLQSGSKVFIWDIDEKELSKSTMEINNPNLNYNVVDISNYEQIQKTIADIVHPALLNHYNKKNLRGLTKSEMSELEYIKLCILCDLEPYIDIDANIINQILKKQVEANPNVLAIATGLIKDFIEESERQPTIDEKRQIYASAYSSNHNS